MITERTLKVWRKESLISTDLLKTHRDAISIDTTSLLELHSRVLRLTQVLLDYHLTNEQKKYILRKEKKLNEPNS